MKSHVEFKTTIFPPYETEEEEINPGIHGKRLAEFLVKGLSQSYEVQEPIAEDWGWVVKIKNDEFGLWLGCGNYEEYENGYLCFIEPHKPIIKKFLFKKINTEKVVSKLQVAIDELLSKNSEIHDVKWSTFEEFNIV